jgi:undecaprenyl-diphosphatase
MMDTLLFGLLNGLAGNWPLFDNIIRFLVNDYVIPTMLSLTLVGLWFSGREVYGRRRRQFAVIHAVAAVIIANILVKSLNLVIFRPRPFATLDVTLLFYRPTDSTLPSNPAAVAFAFAFAVYLHERQWGLALGVMAALFGLARVVAGVHYPLDVVAGALVGLAAAHIALRLPGLRLAARGVIRLGRRLLLA